MKLPWRQLLKWFGYWVFVLIVSAWNESPWMLMASLWVFILMTLPKPKPDATREELIRELRATRAFLERLNLGLDYLLNQLGQKPPTTPPIDPDAP